MTYDVVIPRQIQKIIVKFPVRDGRRILAAIEALAQNPRPPGCKKLTATDVWRVRIGDYRVIYEINDTELVVLIVRVSKRDDAY